MCDRMFSSKFTNNYKIPIFIALLVLLLCGCPIARRTPDVEATVAAALAATQTAQPTSTATLTNTPTRRPTNTPTRRPTNTPTRKPTSTPPLKPTNTPTSVPTTRPTATKPVAAGQVITSTLETGWTLYEVVNEGFSIALPPDWLVIPLDPELFEQALGAVGEKNPTIGRLLGENVRSLAASGVKFYALNIEPETLIYDVPISLNIIKLDVGIRLPLDSYVPIVLKQLESIADPQVPITHRRVTISGVEAEEFKYIMAMNNAQGKSIKGQIIQYLIPIGTVQHTITLVCPTELTKEYTSLLEQIGTSFKLLD